MNTFILMQHDINSTYVIGYKKLKYVLSNL